MRLSKKTIRVLVLGKDGSGKSSLINNMLGEELAKENHCIIGVADKLSVEEHIKTFNKGDTEVVMYDTTAVDCDKDGLVREIVKLGGISTFDVVLFCFNCLQRVDSEMESLVSVLETSFGLKLWARTVFVLTFVNLFLSMHSVRMHFTSEANGEALKRMFISAREKLKTRANIVHNQFNRIPVVFAGCEDYHGIPTTENWIKSAWKVIMKTAKEDSSRVNVWKTMVRSKSGEGNFKNVTREMLVGAAAGAVVGTAISPGMGTVLIGATGAVIGGVSAAYSNKKNRHAIRIVNSITLSENMCDESSYDDNACNGGDAVIPLKAQTKATVSAVLSINPSIVVQSDCADYCFEDTSDFGELSIGNLTEEIMQHFSFSSS